MPVIFVVSNNRFAISVRLEQQTSAQTLAQKAIAAGIEGEQIDGNDIVAVTHAMRNALAKAREGGGPTLIEALTYRLCDHTTADDASRYRDREELSRYWGEEPIARLRGYLGAIGAWRKEDEEALIKESAAKVQQAVDEYLATPMPSTKQMFDHLYATLPAAYASQRDEALGRAHG